MPYNPSLHTVTNKALGIAQANPTDARSYFYDEANFVYRPYNSTAEVLGYLDTPQSRTGQFSIIVTDGVLIHEYWFKDGQADGDLVEKMGGIGTGTETRLLTPGYVSYSGTGLIYDITAATYLFSGVFGSSEAGQVTLSDGGAFDRYDIIGVNSSDVYFVIEGIASANPEIPFDRVDPATQIVLSVVNVKAVATVPDPGTIEIVYDENAEVWNHTASGLTVNFDNTINVYKGAKAIDAGIWTSGDTMTSLLTGTTKQASAYSIINLHIKLKAAMVADSNISVGFYKAGITVSKNLALSSNYGFNRTNTAGYQNITIPLSAWIWVDNDFDEVRIAFTGTGAGCYIDYITLQGGIPQGADESDPVALSKTITLNAGTGVTIPQPATQMLAVNPVWTINAAAEGGAQIITVDDIRNVSTNGLTIQNTTPATLPVPVQYSPRLRLFGSAFKGNAPAESRSSEWVIESRPINSATVPAYYLHFNHSVNGAPYNNPLNIDSNGNAVFLGNVTAGVFTAGSGVVVNNGNPGFFPQIYTSIAGGSHIGNISVTHPNGISTSASGTVAPEMRFAGALIVQVRTSVRGNATASLPGTSGGGVNHSYAAFVVGTMDVTQAASGVHALFAQQVIKALTVTPNGSSTLANTATLYLEGAATAAVTGANYTLWSDAGTNRFDGDVLLTSLPNTDPTKSLTTDATGKVILAASTGGGGGTKSIGVTLDGQGFVLTTGQKGYIRIPYAGTITGWSIISDVVGSCVFDVWKAAGVKPTVANTITAAAKPTLTAAEIASSTTLTGWTTAVAAGDIIGWNLDSVTAITWAILQLTIEPV